MAILKTAPAGANVLDLDAARAARAEARSAAGEGLPLIKVSAGYVEARAEVDLACADDFIAGRISAGLSKLLADPADVEAVLAGGISRDDLEAITNFVAGTTLGESPASSKS
jgi:hypothetical protein